MDLNFIHAELSCPPESELLKFTGDNIEAVLEFCGDSIREVKGSLYMVLGSELFYQVSKGDYLYKCNKHSCVFSLEARVVKAKRKWKVAKILQHDIVDTTKEI